MRSGDQANHDCVRGKGLSRIGREVALEALSVHINGPVPADIRERPLMAWSVERLGSRSRVRNAAKTDLSDRSTIDDRDLRKG